jgi:hypothetical protein
LAATATATVYETPKVMTPPAIVRVSGLELSLVRTVSVIRSSARDVAVKDSEVAPAKVRASAVRSELRIMGDLWRSADRVGLDSARV